MATRKQLKRERKRRTHGIERDGAGHARCGDRREAAVDAQPGRTASRRRTRAHRGRKPVAYPTIWRALKRAPLLAGVWFILIEFVFKPSGSSTRATSSRRR